MPLNYLLKNKLLLQSSYSVSESDINKWFFWKFQGYIDMINKDNKGKGNLDISTNSTLNL